MDYLQNPRIVGSFMIGGALVAGAYVLANFGEPRLPPPDSLSATVAKAPVRSYIEVVDQDQNGIEDWRDQFVVAPAVVIDEEEDTYTPPETITDKLGISLMEDLFRVKAGGPVAKTTEQVVNENVAELTTVVSRDKIYDIRDITTGASSGPEAVRVYGNALANIFITYNVPGLESELDLLYEQMESQSNVDNSQKLKELALMYKNYRDKALALPVPRPLAKVHLDLINVFNALHLSIDAMAQSNDDPMLTLARLKRYDEDAQGFAMALNNVYNALSPYASVFEPNDPILAITRFYQNSP